MEKKRNNKIITVILLIIIFILTALCILFATGTISFKNNKDIQENINSNTNQENTNSNTNQGNINSSENESNNIYERIQEAINTKMEYYDEISSSGTIPTKLVHTSPCVESSEITFNGITIKLKQEKDDIMCATKSFTVNGKEVINDYNGLWWIESYTIYDNNVIIKTSSTSSAIIDIYNLQSNSIIATYGNLEGYKIKKYTIADNKIILDGTECGMECGNEYYGYPRARFEIEYSNNTFSKPKLIEKFTS